MSVGKKVAVNMVIQVVGRVLSVLVGLVSIKILTNYLGLEEFGQYTIVVTFLSMFSIIADLGLNIVLTTEISKDSDRSVASIISNIFTLRIVSACLVWLIWAPIIWLAFDYTAEVKMLIIGGSLGMILMSVGQVFNGVFIKNLRTELIVIGDILARLSFIAGILIGWRFFELSLVWVIGSFVASLAIQFIYAVLSARRFSRIQVQMDLGYWKYTLVEAFPLFLIIAFNLIYYRIDTVMISIIQGPEATGLYGVAYKVIEMVSVFPTMFVGLLLPFFTKYFQANSQYFQQVANKGASLLLLAMLPASVGGAILSQKIILVLSSSEYLPATLAMQILFTSLIWIGFSNLMSHMLIGSYHKQKIMLVSIGGAVVNILLNLVLIPQFSYTGAAIATFITELLVLILYMVQVRRYVRVLPKISWRDVMVVGLATGAMSGVLWITMLWNLFIQIGLGSMVFIGIIFVYYQKEGFKKTFLLQDITEESAS